MRNINILIVGQKNSKSQRNPKGQHLLKGHFSIYKHDSVEDEPCTEIEIESVKPNIDTVPFDKSTTCDFESRSEMEIFKQTEETLKKENAKLKVENSTLKSEMINLKETVQKVILVLPI